MPPSIGTIHPRTDQTVGLDYRFFREVNHELADRGLLTTSAESLGGVMLLQKKIRRTDTIER